MIKNGMEYWNWANNLTGFYYYIILDGTIMPLDGEYIVDEDYSFEGHFNKGKLFGSDIRK